MEQTIELFTVIGAIIIGIPILGGIGLVIQLFRQEIESKAVVMGMLIGGFLGWLAGALSVDLFNMQWDDDFGRNLICGLYGIFFGGLVGAMFGKDTAETQTAAAPRQNPAHDDFAKTAGNAGEFAFDAGRFGAKPPPKKPARAAEPPPRGYDKRHPDDARIWAKIDDPETPDGEVKAAMEAILRKRAQRKGSKGRGVAKRTT